MAILFQKSAKVRSLIALPKTSRTHLRNSSRYFEENKNLSHQSLPTLISPLSSITFFFRKGCSSNSQRGNSNGRYKILHIYVYKKDISKRVPKRIDNALHGLKEIRQWCMWNGVSCISSKRWEKSRHQRVSSLSTI